MQCSIPLTPSTLCGVIFKNLHGFLVSSSLKKVPGNVERKDGWHYMKHITHGAPKHLYNYDLNYIPNLPHGGEKDPLFFSNYNFTYNNFTPVDLLDLIIYL